MPNRRQFLQTTAAAGIGFWLAAGSQARRANRPTSGSPWPASASAARVRAIRTTPAAHGDMVAICDVDENTLDAAGKAFPKAKKFNDFRKMLDEMGKSIDAVTVSTPDHCHAVAAAMAMRLGKHCFCQKPLTHTHLRSPRAGPAGPREEGGHADGQPGHGRRRPAQGGGDDRGPARWARSRKSTSGPIARSGRRAASVRSRQKPPANLHWDLWLGPAPERPYGERLSSRSPGAAGGISAPGPWATWAATP